MAKLIDEAYRAEFKKYIKSLGGPGVTRNNPGLEAQFRENIGRWAETYECLNDPDLMRQIEQSERDERKGKPTHSIEEVSRELGI